MQPANPQAPSTKSNYAKYATILEKFEHQLRLDQKKDITIKCTIARLTQLINNGADLYEPDTIKEVFLRINWKPSTKKTAAAQYTCFLQYIGKTWNKPRITIPEEIYFIPQEAEIDALINLAGATLAPLLQLLKETGARVGEATAIEWKDIDYNNKTVTINHPEKSSLPRIIPISERLILMINQLPKTEKPVFLSRNKDKESIRKNFESLRKRATKKLANPRLMQIHLHTFRHYKATMMFLEHRDQYEVRKLLGHKTSAMTDKYINITETLLKNKEEKYTVKTAKTTEEAIKLIEDGFEHHDNIDRIHLYRKRK